MNNICQSVKNKDDLNIRCNKTVVNGCFCGIHSRSKNKLIFEDIQKKIYTIKTLPLYNNIEKDDLKININYHKLKLENKRDKRLLYTKLLNYLNDKSMNEINSIIIQKYYRGYMIKKLKQCVNQEDFYSLDNILTIPYKYIYIVKENNVNYCFDIRSLKEYFKNKGLNINNPYNNIAFSNYDIKNINDMFKKFKDDINFKIEEDKLSPRQLYKQQVLSVFQNYDNLGFMLNIEWFIKLKFEELKLLYRKCEDVWNYRAQLTPEQKLGIVHNGKLFTTSIIYINRMKINYINELRNIILNELNRAVTEGSNEANRKLGAMLMLTGFAEISQEVMNSYPWLSQSF